MLGHSQSIKDGSGFPFTEGVCYFFNFCRRNPRNFFGCFEGISRVVCFEFRKYAIWIVYSISFQGLFIWTKLITPARSAILPRFGIITREKTYFSFVIFINFNESVSKIQDIL